MGGWVSAYAELNIWTYGSRPRVEQANILQNLQSLGAHPTVISFLAKTPGFWCLPVQDETFYRYSYTLSNTNFGFCS